jgi:signal transduction histidine kinase/ligand-binding sensor domain-containing protein
MQCVRRFSLHLFILAASAGLWPLMLTGQNNTKKLLFTHISIEDGLSQGMITDIIQDRYGFMWLGTKDGLNQYDGYRFSVYRHSPDDLSSLSDSYITALMEDSLGRIWVGTVSGRVDLFDRNSGTFKHIIKQGTVSGVGPVMKIEEGKNGKVWIQIAKTVIEINGETLQHREIPLPPPVPDYMILSRNGKLYSLLPNSLSIRSLTEGKTMSVKFAEEDFQKLIPGTSKQWRRVIEHPSQKKYYVFFDGGIIGLDAISFKTTEVLPYALGFTNQALIDSVGDMWILADTRMVKYDPKEKIFTEVRSKNIEQNKALIISRFFKDRGGIFWFGTGGYGLYKHDPYTEKFHHTDENSIISILEYKGKILINRIQSAYYQIDPEKEYYVDTIARSSGRHFISYKNEFYTLLKDGSKRWFSLDTAIASFDLKTNDLKIYTTPPIRGGMYSPISDIKKDGKGNLWVGTNDGLFCFNTVNQNWKTYRNNPSDSTSLSFNTIFTLCPDPGEPNILWVGTNGGGLNRFDMQTGKFKRYLVKNGLPNNVVYGILPDNDGNLWMSTNNGLSRLDPVYNRFKNFDVNDGLQGNEFNHDAFVKDQDGRLYFGGVNGFNYFYPEEVSTNPIAPNVVITDMTINNKTIAGLHEYASLSKALYLNEKIRLTYDQNMIGFEFAALDFSAPMKNQYQYMLEGFNDNWIYSNNTHKATYTNLDPGTYVFRVKGSNKDGIWNEDGASLTIIILPPWYGTWWFRTLMALTLLSAIYIVYRYRLQQALNLVAVRNRIATDLHDEIGSNLSNISIFSNVAQQISDSEKNVSLLKKISEYSQASQESMSDIVWMINPDNDCFENIMTQMRRYAAEIFEAINCSFDISFDEKLNGIKLNMEERKNLYLIYKEAINNLAKYSGCSEVSIELKLTRGMINMVMKDNGKGFDLDAVSKGNGVTNMRKRAEMLKGRLNIRTSPGHGTEIELNFPA